MFSTTYDEENKLWRGPEIPPLYNPKISLAQVVLSSMKNFGPKIAQISDNNGIERTYSEMRLQTIRAAQNLQSRGYEPKLVFGLMAKNSENVAPIVFASISIGCPVNALDPTFKKTELVHMFSVTKPSVMFCDVEAYDLVLECLNELEIESKIFTFGVQQAIQKRLRNYFQRPKTRRTSLHSKKTSFFVPYSPVEVDGESDMAMIVCSSGTTGLSKGVCLSHAACLDNFMQYDLTEYDDVMLSFSSLYWISGMINLFRGTIKGSTRIITTEPFDPERQLRMIEQYKVTYAFNAPHHVLLMLKSEKFKETDLSSYKKQIVAGGRCPFHIQTELDASLADGYLHTMYGMSEAAGGVSCNYPIPSGKDSVGRLMGGLTMKIIDDDGNRLGPNEDGEVAYITNYKFLGYYANEEATAELFDDEGFILSGDIGHIDEGGDLFIIDRKKDLMKYCNMQISPSAIEAHIIESPGVKAACVVGIPDDFATDLPAAVVIRADGSNISGQEIYDMVAEKFSDHCKLRGGIFFIDVLPTTPSGKVLRRKAREYAIAMYNEHNEQNA